MIIMQGDAYYIPFSFFDDDGTKITNSMVDDVEIVFAGIRRTLSDNEIIYDGTNKRFLFPLTQQETFALPTIGRGEVRLKFTNGDVIGDSFGNIIVLESDSREEL